MTFAARTAARRLAAKTIEWYVIIRSEAFIIHWLHVGSREIIYRSQLGFCYHHGGGEGNERII
jgi:hypothetical protein